MTQAEQDIIRNMMIRMGEIMDRAMEELRQVHMARIPGAVFEEREACAKICADMARQLRQAFPSDNVTEYSSQAAEDCAEAIRERKA